VWLFTTDGFFSAVAHRDDEDRLMIRARVREDAERLAEALGAELLETPAADYRFRVVVSRDTWATYVQQAAEHIDYPNFKDAVAARQGRDRAHVYGDVWSVMYGMQER